MRRAYDEWPFERDAKGQLRSSIVPATSATSFTFRRRLEASQFIFCQPSSCLLLDGIYSNLAANCAVDAFRA